MQGRQNVEGKDSYSYSNLDFLSVEFCLDGRESSQLSKLEKNERKVDIWGKTDTTVAYVYGHNIRVTAYYSLDSPNQPANHEAPERENYILIGFI